MDGSRIAEGAQLDANISSWGHLEDDDDELFLVNGDLNLNTSTLRTDERYMGFDNNVGDTWIYPSNFPERAYQYNIVQKAIFHNTLVVLPTGLGKTFIAAVVMYNMYRWYPMGKVIFMAPTRPLVAQQIEACCKIMGIPKADSVEITGKLNKTSRSNLWQTKRVFFCTPQSVQSDVMDAEMNFPFQAVKLIVVDEAHKAKGRYAYTDVVNCIWKKNKYLRILALSATPGRRKDDVEEVIRNLFISNLEVRTEDSLDVVSYVHKRNMKTVVVQLGQKLTEIRDQLLEITDPHIRNLIDNRLISGRPGSISRNWLVMEQKKFRESLVNNRTPFQRELSSDFSICISVYHAIELLERHGLRVFLNNFDETQEGGPKFVVILRPDLRRLIDRVRNEIGPNPFAYSDQCMVNGEIAAIPPNIDFGHPKFEIARDHVLEHFNNNKEARVIIFCEYRESVMLMHRLLLQHRPLIRPRVFVGQGGNGSIRAVTQQQQINVMNDFRSGESNALIATSVAEEGIDVGEVDLIVCFDINTTNPTRFIQRIGRTGRKKEGKVLLLATEGKEHTVLKEVLSERNKLNKSISRGGEFASIFYKHSPRMVPTEFNPKCMKTFIQPTQVEQPKSKSKDKPAKILSKSNRIANIGQERDLRHFFKQQIILDDEEKCIFQELEAPNSSKANKSAAIMNTTSDENTAIVDFSPPKSIEISNKMVKKIAKYIRSNLKTLPVDASKTVTCNRLSEESLKFLIDFSPDLLRDIWTRMQVLWKKGVDENNMPSRGITPEDRQAVRVYFQIRNIFGSKQNMATIVESRRQIPKAFYFSHLIEKYGFIFGNVSRNGACQDNFEFLMEKFEKMSSLFPFDECSKAESVVYDKDDEMSDTTSILMESSCDYSNDHILDSKYMSQWEVPLDESHNEDISFGTIKLSVSKELNDTAKSKDFSSKTVEETHQSSDDDIVFVGASLQSTPIRTGSLKQTLLNFNETPIARKLLKRSSTRNRVTKRSQKNCLDFIKTIQSTPLAKNSNKARSSDSNHTIKTNSKCMEINDSNTLCFQTPIKSPDQFKENNMDFFDDQFDDIIAANSGIIERIENSTALNQNNKIGFGSGSSHPRVKDSLSHSDTGEKARTPSNSKFNFGTNIRSVPNCSIADIKEPIPEVADVSTVLGSNDSTPDDVVPENVTPRRRISIGDNYSTPRGDICRNSTTPNFGNAEHNSKTRQYSYVTTAKFHFKSDQNLLKKHIAHSVHPELADIDFNDFSETFSEDITDNLEKKLLGEVQKHPRRASPDIFEELSEPISEKSPLKVINSPHAEVSPCLLTKKPLTWKEVRLKYYKPSQSQPKTPVPEEPDESVIHVGSKLRHKRKIIDSDSDSSDNNSPQPQRSGEVIRHRQEFVRRIAEKKTSLPQKKRTNEFIDEEAALSGSASDDELEHTLGCYMADSVVVHDDEVENDLVNMTEVYLQSVRSPSGNARGAFKIPARRQFNDASKIFSQRVPEDNGSYMNDSFLVISDEGSDTNQSMCPLERAEEILKMRRRAKRKAKLSAGNDLKQPAKKKRILRIHNSSEDDDFA